MRGIDMRGIDMFLGTMLLTYSDKIQTVFDLAALCYQYLTDQLAERKMDQSIFIGTYLLDNIKAAHRNFNHTELSKFSVQVERQLLSNDADANHEAQLFETCISKIQSEVVQIGNNLQAYKDDRLNQATVAMYILYAIDRYLGETKRRWVVKAPQNELCNDKVYICLPSTHNILDNAAEKLNFPRTIEPLLIRNQLDNLLIIEQSEFDEFEPPKLVKLWISPYDSVRNNLRIKRKIKIAVVPFEKEHMINFPVQSGTVFQVDYTDWHTEHAVNHALKLLDLAIERGANVVIFPEYVCSKEVQEAIGKHLHEKYAQDSGQMKALLFVVAGSGWMEENNIAHIYSYDGTLLGRQYKKERFSKKGKEGNGYVEGFQNPGKESVLCEVEGIGEFMFAICRDISERQSTKDLTRVFRPQFLLVPAWSTSVHNGFEQQLCEIVDQNHRTCSLICNCCEALEVSGEQREVNGVVVTPYKEETLIKGKMNYFKRTADCWSDGACGGCMFEILFDFKVEMVKKAKIVERITQVRPHN